MLRTTFPEEAAAWRKEVERMLHGLTVDQRRTNQLIGPAQSSGVVIGGNPPTEKLCMAFDIDISVTPAPSCTECVSDCKKITLSADIVADSGVIFAAGDYILTFEPLVGSPCFWVWRDPAFETHVRWFHLNVDSSGNSAVTFQDETAGVMYYNGAASCTAVTYTDVDSIGALHYTSHPSSLTIADDDCSGTTTTTSACTDTLQVHAEIKWNATSFKWVQSYFSVDGTEGGGTIDATFSGATFTIEVDVSHSCYTGNATFHAPIFLDDHCRPVVARRATAAEGWPTSITGQCIDCTPHTTTTSTSSTSSTTGSSTTGSSTTTGSTTTGSSTTGSSTTGSSTTGSTTTPSSTTTETSSTTSPPTGRCCYGSPGSEFCTVNTQSECEAFGTYISWSAGLDCTGGDPNPCRTGGSSTTETSSTTAGSTTETSSTTSSCSFGGCIWIWGGSSWAVQSNECSVECVTCTVPPGFSGSMPGETASTMCGT